jgi:PhnB protein
MQQPIAYLAFNGNCEEAMRFYERVLDGKLELVVRFSDMPGPAAVPADQAGLVAHARLAVDGGVFYGGDCPPSYPYEGIKGVNLTLNYDTVERAQQVFAALSDGGKVGMPMKPAMWAKVAGMVTDRFGVPWIVNGILQEVRP